MRLGLWFSLGLSAFAGPVRTPVSPPLPPIAFNDNRVPAGTLAHGVLTVSLVAQAGEWKPMGPDGGSVRLLAFGEAGKALQDPGPLIRVPLGTRIHLRMRNLTRDTLRVYGLAARRVTEMDSLVVLPGAVGDARFTADAPGTFYYWGNTQGEDFDSRTADDDHLNGALIVDPAGPVASDRVLVIERWAAVDLRQGLNDLYTVNGRPWPFTERLTYDVGDSIRWRVINATNDVHPLHLHGFYYRVDAKGDIAQDTVYWPAQRRLGVTEPVWDGTTMDMAWRADRPGGWIFHCHLNYHVLRNAGLPPDTEPPRARLQHVLNGFPAEHVTDHAQHSMGGLVIGLQIRAPANWHSYDGQRRTLRLLVESDSGPGDSLRRYGYLLENGNRQPSDSLRVPGPPIVLRRGEPTRIWVVNHTPGMTQVHWHGLEVESYYDGVAGMSGTPGRVEPPIMPGDSFAVLVTPPRAGSFMYHTHINDMYQQTHGLYGPLIVLDSGATWNPDSDRVFMIGTSPDQVPVLNGGGPLAPLSLKVGVPYRFRFMNITVGSPGVRLSLVRAGAPVQWRWVAKDGQTLPDWQGGYQPATQAVNIGETYDFIVQAPDTGSVTLELRGGSGRLYGSQLLRFGR